MKRFHVHLAVSNLEASIRFYNALFAAEPDVIKEDYAKWMLEDPSVNFAISQRSASHGLDHLGFQVDSDAELAQINDRLEAAELPSIEESGTACCYSRSNKYWSVDPQGIAWEGFHSLSEIPTFNEAEKPGEGESACCVPEMPKQQNCCS